MLCISVQVSCVEPQKVLLKQDTIAEPENDTKTEQKVDESATENSEITLSLNGSDILPTTIIVSDLSTSALLSEAEDSAGELEEVTVATTALDSGTYNTNDTASAESDSETITTNLPTANTEPAHETVAGDLGEAITDPVNGTVVVDSTENNANASEETLNTEETISESDVTDGDMVTNSTTTTELPNTSTNSTTTTELSDISTNSTTPTELPATPTPTSTSTTTTTTETPTTPIDILCPQVYEDPKYKNETFDLKLAEFMKKNPLAKVYKSPGFPDPYAENLNCTLRCVGVMFLKEVILMFIIVLFV